MQDMITTPDQQSTAQMITALQTENAVLREELALVQEQLEWLKKQVFGRKTEQTSVIMDGGHSFQCFLRDRSKLLLNKKKQSQFRRINARRNAPMMIG